MHSKLVIPTCLLVLTTFASGCVGSRFTIVPDREALAKNYRVVAAVTCIEANPREYLTFFDRHFSLLYPASRVRWSAEFRVDELLKGSFDHRIISLVDARDFATPYSRIRFQVGQSYVVGFNHPRDGRVTALAVVVPSQE